MREEKVAAVIGLNYQGLAVVRLLGQSGYNVFAFPIPHEMLWGEFRRSKYLRGKNKVQPYQNISQLFGLLKDLEKNTNGKLKVFVTSADSLADLLMNGKELWNLYEVYTGPMSALEMLTDKKKMYTNVSLAGLDTKRYCLLEEYTPKCIEFPIVLKRNIEKPGMMAYKCVKLNSEKELLDFAFSIPSELKPYILLQECISDDFKDLDFRGYIHNGKIIGYALVQEVRCYPEGVPSYLEEINNELLCNKIEQKLSAFFKVCGVRGFIGVDLKYNESTDECYILDVNPRPPASISSWVLKYSRKDLIHFFANIDNPEPLLPRRRNVKWANVNREYQVWSRAHLRFSWWQTICAKHDVWDSKDPLPYLLQPYYVIHRLLCK